MTTTAPPPVRSLDLTEQGPAAQGSRHDEVVVALSPAFGGFFTRTIVDVPHASVLRELFAGVEEEGASLRVGKFRLNGENAPDDRRHVVGFAGETPFERTQIANHGVPAGEAR